MGNKTAEERIGEFLRFGSRLGLERMTDLMHRLGDPHDDLDVIHIAGTNGKGSTSRYIYEALIEAGYHAGIYTSPYLEKFNERIEADRRVISDEDLDECTDEVLAKVSEMTAEGKESPTEFEVVTAVAFVWFSRIGCDAVVLEVGLGGRGDSTNIIKAPVITVITSISYDHMDRLGSTITEIAGEKAGIIKASCPVVVSTEREEALSVFREKAASLGAPLYDARQLTTYTIKELRPDGAAFNLTVDLPSKHPSGTGEFGCKCTQNEQDRRGACDAADSGQVQIGRPSKTGQDRNGACFEDLKISMGGEHQVINAAEAVTALLVQDRFKVDEDAIRRGIARAKQPGRFEILYKPGTQTFESVTDPDLARTGNAGTELPVQTCSEQAQAPKMSCPELEHPWVIIDGAHNQDAAKRLRLAMGDFFPGRSVLFVCGILGDKDVSGILDQFVKIGTDFVATEPENDRKLSAYDLAKEIHERGKMVYEIPKPEDAAALAMSIAKGYDVVLFTGSLYLIGKIRTLLRERYLKPGDVCFDRPDADDSLGFDDEDED